MAKGLLGSLFSNVGLIQKGASMMGYTLPTWATGAMEIAGQTFGGRDGGGGGGGMTSREPYRRAVDLGGTVGAGEKLIGPGEQKASAAVEYEDELRSIEAALRLYAEAE